MPDLTGVVVTVDATVMDGTVVRWYRDEATARRRAELVSASRRHVQVGADSRRHVQVGVECTSRAEVSDLIYLIDVAGVVMCRLQAGRDVSGLATHTRTPNGDLEPVQREVPR